MTTRGSIPLLIVDDEPPIRRLLRTSLAVQGYRILEAGSARVAFDVVAREAPEVMLLDLGLPDQDGLEVIRQLRAAGSKVAIVVLSSRGDESGKVEALDLGADDYVTKPFGIKELVARVNANLKRSTASLGSRGRILETGDLWLDTKNFTARVKGEPLNLRLKEFELLMALASQPGELKSREELAKEVWGHAGVGSSRTIDVHIRRIRASLSASDYEYIHTARGLGYRFEARPKRAGDGEVSPVVEREIVEPRG